jgi:hypothetical protein
MEQIYLHNYRIAKYPMYPEFFVNDPLPARPPFEFASPSYRKYAGN